MSFVARWFVLYAKRMILRPRGLILLTLSAGLALGSACSTPPPANTNQSSANPAPSNTNAPPSNSAQTKTAQQSNQSSTGTIEVTSVPPGARVLLISNDETGAGEPQSKGLTPTTVSGVKPGKYTVHLERPGYRFAQQEITVKAGGTVKVSKTLKKQ